ncbi:hypothetical protein B0A48_18427 [Cryoendolithus antarcticus]|uniref:Transmembrane protein 135 N-terminal domain-containing protein n=1 Tax=Cryoendolithus antarcticus TaxID=1507870 RepID=A0A1V8S8G1_9PEZI|nr:hypothetical protein B0A48_18427 [Cryoendolithus antarcticus]
MSSSAPSSGRRTSSSAASSLSKRPLDPITRTALRYTISPREYELLHQYLISRAPERVQKQTPNPPRYEKITRSTSAAGDHNAASLRAALRVFVAAYTGLKGWELVLGKLAGRRGVVAPPKPLRMTIAIYVFSRSLEFGYNALEEGRYIWTNGKPKWFGSWLIMPFACGQLLHAFVLDRDCFPESYGKFILQRSPEYIQLRPTGYPGNRPWPSTFDIVDALASLSDLKWPAFVSPILFPDLKAMLPPALAKVSSITSPAHPGIKHTSCAVLHPSDPSCTRTYFKYFTSAFPSVVKFFTLIYGAFALLAYKALLKDPLPFLNRLSARILRISVFITGAIGTSWGSICLFNHLLPRAFLPTQRWFLGGFLGGLWAFVARQKERGNFLYSLRVSIDSLWKVGRKRRWWKGVKNGDVLVFVASLALMNVVYEARAGAVKGAVVVKGMELMRGDSNETGDSGTAPEGEATVQTKKEM